MNATSNPFSTKYIRPGAMAYVGKPNEIETTIERWRKANWIGQIVGPHGSGKTTMTIAIEESIRGPDQSKRCDFCANPRRITIRRERKLRIPSWTVNEPSCTRSQFDAKKNCTKLPSLLIVDGIANLSWLQRWLVVQSCQAKRIGLLITTHKAIFGLPIIARSQPDELVFQRLVNQLITKNHQFANPDDQDDLRSIVSFEFASSRGNLREAFMSLYDVYERKAKNANFSAARR